MRFTRKLALIGLLGLCCVLWTALTPQQIAVNSAAFSAYSDYQLETANTYLLASIAGVAINPANILSNAAGFGSYSDRQLQEAQTYLLSQITSTGSSGVGLPGTNQIIVYEDSTRAGYSATTPNGLWHTNVLGGSEFMSNGNFIAVGPSGSSGALQLYDSGGASIAIITNGSLWLLNPARTNYIASTTLDMSGPSETYSNMPAADITYVGFTGINSTNFNTKLIHFLNSDSSVHYIVPPAGVITNALRNACTNARTADLLITIKPGVFTNWDWMNR